MLDHVMYQHLSKHFWMLVLLSSVCFKGMQVCERVVKWISKSVWKVFQLL